MALIVERVLVEGKGTNSKVLLLLSVMFLRQDLVILGAKLKIEGDTVASPKILSISAGHTVLIINHLGKRGHLNWPEAKLRLERGSQKMLGCKIERLIVVMKWLS